MNNFSEQLYENTTFKDIEQIAGELGSSRVVISRLLKKLENSEKVLLFRHQVKLLDKLMAE